MDRPTRTLVVAGDKATLDNLYNELKGKSDVREVYRHPINPNALCIIIYDIRVAETMYKELQNNKFNVFYTFSKYEIPLEIDKCDESKNQGSVYITFKNGRSIDEREFMNYLNEIGEIKEVKVSSGLIKCVEFYDTRCATRTREALNNKTYNGSSVSVRNVWDFNSKTRNEVYQKVEDELRKVVIHETKEIKRKEKVKKDDKTPFLYLLDEFIMDNIDDIVKLVS